jgi:poly(A) polymerase
MPDVPQNSSRPPCHRDDALAIVTRLREHGHIAYFAGGCVRDLLLGLEPKDYDVATDAPPARVRELFSNTLAVGAAFGVILVRHGKSTIEVATFRADSEYQDGRRPMGVRFTSAEEDAKRRDFTINGLFLDPIEDRVIDYVGGQEDLRAKIVRAIGDPEARFREDHLRLLRAIRFAARLGFEIDAKTGDAIRHHAAHLVRISPERIAEELRLIWTRYDAHWAWYAMVQEYPGIADAIFRFAGPIPTDRNLPGVFDFDPALPLSFGLALAATSLDWARLQNRSAPLRSLVEHDNIARMVRAMRQSLRISNDETDAMRDTLEGLRILLTEGALPVAQAKRFLQRATAAQSRRLLQTVVCLVGQQLVAARNDQLDELLKTDFAPAPFITGDDLVAAGYAPGKQFKQVLNDVYDAQLEDRITTKEQALQLAKDLFKPAG